MEQRKGLISFGNFIYGVCAKGVSGMIYILRSPGKGCTFSIWNCSVHASKAIRLLPEILAVPCAAKVNYGLNSS